MNRPQLLKGNPRDGETMIPAFDEAIAKFQVFLEGEGLPREIVWVAPEHTIFCRPEWKVFEGEGVTVSEVRAAYDAARQANSLGIELGVLCTDRDSTYCYLYIPADEYTASRKLLANTIAKFTSPVTVPSATRVRRGIRSMWYQLRELRFRDWKNSFFNRD